MRDGGSAFPNVRQEGVNGGGYVFPQPGMTLRDYFAAAALTGLLGNDGWYRFAAEAAARAYAVADAMLAVRAVDSGEKGS